MGRRRRGTTPRGPRDRDSRRLRKLAALADGLPAPLLVTDPQGRPIHANPAFLWAFGPPPSPWTALGSGADRGALESAWLAAGASRAPRDAAAATAAGPVLARVAPIESGRRLLGWSVALAPQPATAAAAPPSPEPDPAAQAERRAAEDRLALAHSRRRKAEALQALAEARADRLADRLRSLEAERRSPPAPAPLPVTATTPASEPEPPARSGAAPGRPSTAPRPDPGVPPEPPPSAAARQAAPAATDPVAPHAPEPASEPAPESAPESARPPEAAPSTAARAEARDGPPQVEASLHGPGAEAALAALDARLVAPALRAALGRWRQGRLGDGALDDLDLDRLALAELGPDGAARSLRTLRAVAASPLPAAFPLGPGDPAWGRCLGRGLPVAQVGRLALGPDRRCAFERLLLPLAGPDGPRVLLLEVTTSSPAVSGARAWAGPERASA